MIRILLTIMLIVAAVADSMACTSAIIGPSASASGRPLLWKNRDTSHQFNFVGRVEPTADNGYTYGFVALFNSGDTDMREAWIGMNDAGFAVMNTQSYNLGNDESEPKDCEGLVMARALGCCATVDDFAALLDALPRPMGVEANFGVIDAEGRGAFFETGNHGYVRYDIDADHPVLIRSNFSVSGGEGGLGQVRYDDACHLLKSPASANAITPQLLTDGLSRSFYNAKSGADLALSGKDVADNGECIPRYSTSASVVVEGVVAGVDPSEAVMWTLMGYPPCGVTEPVTLSEIPADLQINSKASSNAADRANADKEKVYYVMQREPLKRGIRMRVLSMLNEANRAASLENYESFRKK